jgi:hypothetical protein
VNVQTRREVRLGLIALALAVRAPLFAAKQRANSGLEVRRAADHDNVHESLASHVRTLRCQTYQLFHAQNLGTHQL